MPQDVHTLVASSVSCPFSPRSLFARLRPASNASMMAAPSADRSVRPLPSPDTMICPPPLPPTTPGGRHRPATSRPLHETHCPVTPRDRYGYNCLSSLSSHPDVGARLAPRRRLLPFGRRAATSPAPDPPPLASDAHMAVCCVFVSFCLFGAAADAPRERASDTSLRVPRRPPRALARRDGVPRGDTTRDAWTSPFRQEPLPASLLHAASRLPRPCRDPFSSSSSTSAFISSLFCLSPRACLCPLPPFSPTAALSTALPSLRLPLALFRLFSLLLLLRPSTPPARPPWTTISAKPNRTPAPAASSPRPLLPLSHLCRRQPRAAFREREARPLPTLPRDPQPSCPSSAASLHPLHSRDCFFFLLRSVPFFHRCSPSILPSLDAQRVASSFSPPRRTRNGAPTSPLQFDPFRLSSVRSHTSPLASANRRPQPLPLPPHARAATAHATDETRKGQ